MAELHWISVPGGIDRQEWIVRVLIVPHLDGVPLHNQGMDVWPPRELLAPDAAMKVEFATEDRVVIASVTVPPKVAARRELWRTFFGSGMHVAPARDRRLPADRVKVAPTTVTADAVVETFKAVAREPVASLSDASYRQAVHRELTTRWTARAANGRSARRLSRRSGSQPPFDVHAALAMLREHPAVLRELGLILELKVTPDPQQREAIAAAGAFLVGAWWPAQPPRIPRSVKMWTRFDLSTFLPASTSSIDRGFVTMPNDRWQLVGVDVDTGANRLEDAARSLSAMASGEEHDHPPHVDFYAAGPTDLAGVSMPTLRSAGIMLMCRDRQKDFDARTAAAQHKAGLDDLTDATLTADDLCLGYRIDVADADQWLSLNQRKATYKIARQGQVTSIAEGLAEEGHIKPFAAIDDGDGTLHNDDVVARWVGWSNGAPRPDFDPPARRPPPRQPALPYEFEAKLTAADGSLPALRFTKSYRMRARVADVAGGGLPLGAVSSEAHETQPLEYQRYEPIMPPKVLLPEGVTEAALGPGEHVMHVVLRSDLAMTTSAFAAANPTYRQLSTRELRPPEALLRLAEEHGALDRDDMTPEKSWACVQQDIAASKGRGLGLPDYAAVAVVPFKRAEPDEPAVLHRERHWPGWDSWPNLAGLKVALREGPTRSVAWEESSGSLVVTLPQAEQMTVELSSLPRAGIDGDFAVQPFVDAQSHDTIVRGRHPLVTPTESITFVHAVRRPLQKPDATLQLSREEGQTFVTLHHPDAPTFNIDAKSTGQLDIDATWTDVVDAATPEQHSNVVLRSYIIGSKNEELSEPIRHEFGDTRRRTVSYRLTATSRFRDYFKDTANVELFCHRNVLGPFVVPNSARPEAPVVLSARPAFKWDLETEHGADFELVQKRRLGGIVRVQLARPWYQTGEEEQLAVLTWWSQEVGPIGKLPVLPTSMTSQVAGDPIKSHGYPPRRPAPGDFTARSGNPVNIKLNGNVVVAVPHTPWFHKAENCWFADIELSAATARIYCPFVRLSLTRYQPQSLPGLESSLPMLTDYIPLLPDRTLKVKRQLNHVALTLTGYAHGSNRVDFILEEQRLNNNEDAPGSDLVALDAEAVSRGDPLGAWIPIQVIRGQRFNVVSVDQPPSTPEAIFTFAGDKTRRGRIRVLEVEELSSGQTAPAGIPLAERIVYTDVFNL
jgi:hypothetical protein